MAPDTPANPQIRGQNYRPDLDTVSGVLTMAAPDPTVVVAEVLRLLLALTVPHMVVVLWLDRTTDPGNDTPPPSIRWVNGS